MITKREIALLLLTVLTSGGIVALAQTAKPVMGSVAVDWNTVEVKPTNVGSTRKFFESPTATLELLECHVTTLNPGETSHPPHQHPEEELVIVKEGTVEVLVNGEWKRVGPGSVIFNASNVQHALRNVGDGPATYHVFMWRSATTPKKAAQPAGQEDRTTNSPASKPAMGSGAFDWNSIEVKPTKTGERRQFFQSPTATLDELECHVTTLNKGEAAHAPHQHPEEELIIVKDGTIEVVQGGTTNRVGPGSVIFHASNVLHGMRNTGDGTACYFVFKWVSPGAKKQAMLPPSER